MCTLPKKKETAGMKHIAPFPSVCLQENGAALTWVDSQGNGQQIWCRATYKDETWGNEA